MSGEGGRGAGDDDSSDDGLWVEFENAATSVAHLFRGANWRNLQTAAASTTQLYKLGLEAKKRSFEKGYTSGRQALATDIIGLCRPYSNKIDVEEVVKILSRYALLPPNHEHHGMHSPRGAQRARNSQTFNANIPADGGAAVSLFQQALCPPASSSPTSHRSPELTNFLQTQVYRHRKRPHSPGSHSPHSQSPNNLPSTAYSDASHSPNYLNKRFKRL